MHRKLSFLPRVAQKNYFRFSDVATTSSTERKWLYLGVEPEVEEDEDGDGERDERDDKADRFQQPSSDRDLTNDLQQTHVIIHGWRRGVVVSGVRR